uniref:Leucine Rich Repeat domain-containing protein n=1 Tax=Coccidioides posadasii RMSCC 3488 TaxID=454284 RepID=A0A0J6FKN7_COCPO|nr:leucine Rich Repeat domain-containing protein [Coccidioides posadasii RMSCC 3488]
MPPQQGPSMPRDVKALQRHGESQPLALGRGDSVALLNGRAAAHCALGDLKAGLRDGKQMIRIDKSDPRGYLRTAKILQLMQKFEEAHKLYFYSLRMIDEHAPERKQIEALMLKTKKRIIPPKRSQSFGSSWAVASRGSGKISTLPSPKDRSVSPAVRAFVCRTNGGVKEASLARINPTVIPKVLELLSRCPDLNYLKVTAEQKIDSLPVVNLKNLKTLIVLKCTLPRDKFWDIMSSCPRLERVEAFVDVSSDTPDSLPQLSNLRCLRILFSHPPGYLVTGNILFQHPELKEVMPNLEELHFEGAPSSPWAQAISLSDYSSLKKFTYMRIYLHGLLVLPVTLEYLRLEHCTFAPPLQGNPVGQFSRLKSAIFQFCYPLSPDMLESLLVNNERTLTHLTISWCSDLAQEHLEPLITRGLFRSITHLDISGVIGVNDAITPLIINNMPNLKVLNLSATRISGLTIKQLVDAETPKIEKIVVDTVSRDAIQYGLSRNIQVSQLP